MSASKAAPEHVITTPYPHKYKTSLCRNWLSTGKCEFEKKCSFAHGDHELQDKNTFGSGAIPSPAPVTERLSNLISHSAAKASEGKSRKVSEDIQITWSATKTLSSEIGCGSSTMSTDIKESSSRIDSEFDEKNEILIPKIEDSCDEMDKQTV